MFQLIVIGAIVASVSTLSDVDQACVNDNTAELSNDSILGSWFKIYRFQLFGGYLPSAQCTEIKFTKPTEAELQVYKDKYNTNGLPYSLDDSPMNMDEFNGYYEGLIMGDKEAKFYILKPNSGMVLSSGYSVRNYRRIDDKYMLFWECAMRGHDVWLLTRDRNASVEEMLEIIKSRPEVNRLDASRFCATW